MKVKTRILIIAGALAAIADQPATWDVASMQLLPTGTLDDQHTELRYIVHVDWHGPIAHNGHAQIQLDVDGQTPTPQPVNVTLYATNLADPSITQSAAAPIVVGSTTHANVDLDSWYDCTSNPCSEDYELRVTRAGVQGLVVKVGGVFTLDTEGTGAQPTDAYADIIVTGPTP